MRILMVCQYDWAGAVYGLMEAVNEHTEHLAQAITFHTTPLGYPCDVLAPNWVDLWRLLEWADVLNLYDGVASALPDEILSKKKVVKSYLGSEYRRNWQYFNQQDAERGWPQTCTTIDLSLYGPAWLGQPVDEMRRREPDDGPFVVCHAPTNKDRKGTALIIRALDGLDGIRLDILENLSHAQCMERKSAAHILIDQVGPNALGYGRNALEAWALGMPVISSAPSEVREALEQLTKNVLPFYQVGTAREIRAAVKRMRDNPNFYVEWRAKGAEFLRKWHSPAAVASCFVRMCQRITLPKVYSHPRSGTAFLAATLKKCFYQDADTVGGNGYAGHWSDRFEIEETPYGALIGDHSFWSGQKGIYIHRDGRDVAVSLWRSKTLQNPTNHAFTFTEFLHQPLDWHGLPSYQTEGKKVFFAEHWNEHLDSWRDKPGVLMVRYEDLILRSAETLRAIGKHIGTVPTSLEPKARLVGLEPHEGHIGTWRDYFTKNDLEFFYTQVRPDYWGFYHGE